MADKTVQHRKALLKYALSLPETFEDHPWGESVAKVGPPTKAKIFVFFGVAQPKELMVCVKLPESGADVLALPFSKPAGYGMGKHGWVHATFSEKELPPLELLEAWVLESYRTVAAKKLVAALDGGVALARAPSRKRSPAAKSARHRRP